jgi:hypothetical protein
MPTSAPENLPPMPPIPPMDGSAAPVNP